MTPDRHLGSAWIDKCRPDILITESTYATTIRDSKRCRERDFLKKVHSCVENGGKVRGRECVPVALFSCDHFCTDALEAELFISEVTIVCFCCPLLEFVKI